MKMPGLTMKTGKPGCQMRVYYFIIDNTLTKRG